LQKILGSKGDIDLAFTEMVQFVVVSPSKYLGAAFTLLTLCILSACQRNPSESRVAVDGALVFASACARCHGADGCGGIAMGSTAHSRNFCESSFQASHTDEQLKQTISKGKGVMPAFGDDYNEEQLTALVRHIRSIKPVSTQ